MLMWEPFPHSPACRTFNRIRGSERICWKGLRQLRRAFCQSPVRFMSMVALEASTPQSLRHSCSPPSEELVHLSSADCPRYTPSAPWGECRVRSSCLQSEQRMLGQLSSWSGSAGQQRGSPCVSATFQRNATASRTKRQRLRSQVKPNVLGLCMVHPHATCLQRCLSDWWRPGLH